jgi:O-antigen/teichoic acid export membrane protein
LSLRRQLGVSLLVQGAGSASLLLATLWLGASLGPEPQGAFSRTKAEIEFVAAFAMFGLPQALFYFVKSSRLGGDAALRWAAGSAVLAVPIAALYMLVQHPQTGAWPIAALALAVGLGVFQGQLRALLLVGQRTEWFNVVTALPQLVLLAGVLVLVAAGSVSEQRWSWLFALAFGSAAAFALWRLKGSASAASTYAAAGWRELGHYGLAAWLAAALYTAAILLVQRWVENAQGAAVLGVFTMALTLVQVPLTPVSYAAPLLFRRWMEEPGAQASQRWALMLFGALLGIAALLWLAAPLWPRLGLGAGYDGLARALAVLLVGGAAEAASRVLGVQANASGTPWVAVRAELARWVVLWLGWLLLLPTGVLAMCALWSVAAIAAAAVFALQMKPGGSQGVFTAKDAKIAKGAKEENEEKEEKA